MIRYHTCTLLHKSKRENPPLGDKGPKTRLFDTVLWVETLHVKVSSSTSTYEKVS